MLLLSLIACLNNARDAYEQRLAELTDDDGDGFNDDEGDCDDADATIYPAAPELCDEVDNDCDGEVDEDVEEIFWSPDVDGDGYGAGGSVIACDQPVGYVSNGSDCDDTDDAIHPGADEVPYDGIDNDCSDGDDDDLDGDGYASIAVGGDDCDDGDDTTHPGAAETWENGATDNDCDGDYGAAVLEYGADAWTGEAAGDYAGIRISALGDVTGDGLAEFLTSAVYQSSAYENGGAVYIVSGATPGPLSEEGVLLAEAEDQFIGASLDGGTDMDGDGVVDALVSSVNSNDGTGLVWLLSGAMLPGEGESAAISAPAIWSATGDEPGSYAGSGVVFLGDVTGDGVEDIAFGATYSSSNGLEKSGRVGIWSGMVGDGGTLADADVVIDGDYAGALMGTRIQPAGDQDGDGYNDYMVAYGDGVIARIFPGGVADFVPEEDFISQVVEDEELDVTASFMLGDLDGDGQSDLGVIVDSRDTVLFTVLAANPTRTEQSETGEALSLTL